MPDVRRLKTWGLRPKADLPRSSEVSATEAASRAEGATDDQLSAGDVVGNRYLLTSVLGEGGMGAIWLARDLKLDIDVALKFIHHDMVTEQSSERLLQEARAVARLDHPSIVRIFDFGETETGEPFMAMEVLRGELLAEVLERKVRLAPPNAVSTLLPVASAVAAAHAKGVVHRDLKPENILLVTNEDSGAVVPKVLDFGIAKLRGKSNKAKRITENDAIVGTPDYMPPEQASGVGEVDQRADVWALCVVLYEAIVGRRPFEGPSPAMVLIAIATQDPTPITEVAAGDDALWEIISKGLAKEADQRWQTMRELGTALARWAVDNGVTTDVAGTSLAVHWLAERGRRPLSELPPAPVEEVLVELSEPPPATPAGRPPPKPRSADAVPPPRTSGPGAETRTGGTWPPRAVERGFAAPSLESLVQPVSLPPELEPRGWRWVGWLVVLGLIGGVVYLYVHREDPTIRPWLDYLGITSAAPTVSAPPPQPAPAPRPKPSGARTAEPPATATAGPKPSPLTPKR